MNLISKLAVVVVALAGTSNANVPNERCRALTRMLVGLALLFSASHAAHGNPILGWDQGGRDGGTRIFAEGLGNTIVTGFDVSIHWGPDAEGRDLFLDFISANDLCSVSFDPGQIDCGEEELEFFLEPDLCPGFCATGLRWAFRLTYEEESDFARQLASRIDGFQPLFDIVLNPLCCALGEPIYVWFSNSTIYGLDDQVLLFVPEPGTLALFTLGLLGLGLTRRRAA